MTTIKDIKNRFFNYDSVEQVKSKQLFLVHYPSYSLLVSYRTIIGIAIANEPYQITTEKFSQTTSHQVAYFRNNYDSVMVEPATLEGLLTKHNAIANSNRL